MAIDESHDVWMEKATQDGDLGREVVFEFLVQLAHVDGFDGHGLTLFDVYAAIDLRKAAFANVFQAFEVADHFR